MALPRTPFPFVAGLVSLGLLVSATPSYSGWADLLESKTNDATNKVQNRAGSEVDDKVDDTVNCIFNPTECARSMKKDDPPEAEAATKSGTAKSGGGGPPKPPSATQKKAGPPPPPSARVWYVDVGGGSTQEVGETELVEMIVRGEVSRSTPVWTDGFGTEYQPAGDAPQLERHFLGQ